MVRSLFVIPVLVAVASAADLRDVAAQAIYHWWPTSTGFHGSGSPGDVDADGILDFAIGGSESGAPGTVRIFSGATGLQILMVQGVATGDQMGISLSTLGDVDHDGHDDFAALDGASYIQAFSGANGGVLWHANVVLPPVFFGSAPVVRGADLDADGIPDLVIGSQGQVIVLSAATGAVVRTIMPPGASPYFGAAVADAGDFDLDGIDDVLVGDADVSIPGRVTVHSGATGAVLQTFVGNAAGNYFGASIASVGDVDGDLVPEIVIGSPSQQFGLYHTGRAELVSGATGVVLFTFDAPPSTYTYARTVNSYADLDGDGKRDILIQEGNHHGGCCLVIPGDLVVFSSATGQQLERIGIGFGGARTSLVPDVDGDGRDDFMATGIYTDLGFGAVLVLTDLAFPMPVTTCPPKTNSAGCVPTIQFTGAPSLSFGPDLTVTASQLMGNTMGVFMWSRGGAAIPFGGGTLCLANPLTRSRAIPIGGATGSCSGTMTHAFTKQQLNAFGYAPGTQLVVQGWYRDYGFSPPNAVGLTSAIQATIWY